MTRTFRTEVTFASPFNLKPIDGLLLAGTYAVEVDEEEMVGMHRSAWVRTATLFTVAQSGTSRVFTVKGSDLDAALISDGQAPLQR